MRSLWAPDAAGDDVPYQYDAEAAAGISLATAAPWYGSRIRFRRGTSGRWRHVLAVDVHPMDEAAVEAALRAYLAETSSSSLPTA